MEKTVACVKQMTRDFDAMAARRRQQTAEIIKLTEQLQRMGDGGSRGATRFQSPAGRGDSASDAGLQQIEQSFIRQKARGKDLCEAVSAFAKALVARAEDLEKRRRQQAAELSAAPSTLIVTDVNGLMPDEFGGAALPEGGVANWSTTEKLVAALTFASQEVGGEAGAKLLGLLSPSALVVIGATLTISAASHAFGVGEAADLVLLVGGLIFIGRDAISALESFTSFAIGVVGAKTESDLRTAGDDLARAVAIVGIDGVLVWLTHESSVAYQGRYQSSVEGDPVMEIGHGNTDKYGNVRYSAAGSDTDQALARYHEMVHSYLSPKLIPFREFRADLRMTAYKRSAFLRYFEEALAESYAQMRVNGVKGLPTGIRFPIANGYVTLTAVLKEAAIGTVTVGGMTYYVYLQTSAEQK